MLGAAWVGVRFCFTMSVWWWLWFPFFVGGFVVTLVAC